MVTKFAGGTGKAWAYIKEKTSAADGWLRRHPIVQCIVLALILNLTVEALSRRSLLSGLGHMAGSLLVFILNSFIILLSLILAIFFKRRYFVFMLISAAWLILGVANCVLLGFRATPLAAVDFQILGSVMNIIGVYLRPYQIVLILLALLGVLALLVLAFIKMPKTTVRYSRSLISILVLVALFSGGTSFSIQAGVISSDFPNFADAYDEFGFAYCFSTSLIDRGIDQPEDYSSSRVNSIMNSIGESGGNTVLPNVIFLQLESFFDINYINGLSFSENPVPNFTQLKESSPSGFLSVPWIGSGTVNTEFEVLCGMNLDFFGTGEYPYKTVLLESATESLCYNLKEFGYTTHAIHNHEGSFYDRHLVYPNLGFDSFTSIEYMQDRSANALGWSNDSVLTDEILKTLESGDGQEFVYAVSVQAHGKYPEEELHESTPVKVYGLEDESLQAGYDYYVNQIHEVDAFIGELIDALSQLNEPVILVLFGDHLPSLGLEDEMLENGDKYQTEYVIWNNLGLHAGDRDLEAYQLSSHVLQLLGADSGIMTKLHQGYSGDADYQAAMQLLQYDMLYGEGYVFDSGNPYTPADMRMGISAITIDSASISGGVIQVRGSGFTASSVVFCDDEALTTQYISDTLLQAIWTGAEPPRELYVGQVGSDSYMLSRTELYRTDTE